MTKLLDTIKELCKNFRTWVDSNRQFRGEDFDFKETLFDILEIREELLYLNIYKEPIICEFDLSELVMYYVMVRDKDIENWILQYIDFWITV